MTKKHDIAKNAGSEKLSADSALRSARAMEKTAIATKSSAEAMKDTAKYTKTHIIILLVSVILLAISVVFTTYYNKLSNERDKITFEQKKELYEWERKILKTKINPQIQFRPKYIIDMPATENVNERLNANLSFRHILFTLVNYSAFDAKDIHVDLKYGNRPYIAEWVSADNNNKNIKKRLNKKEISYSLFVLTRTSLPVLKAGEESEDLKIGGNIDLTTDVCKVGEIPVFIRLSWKSDNGYKYNRTYEYKLRCTMVDQGKSFVLFPHQIVSREE